GLVSAVDGDFYGIGQIGAANYVSGDFSGLFQIGAAVGAKRFHGPLQLGLGALSEESQGIQAGVGAVAFKEHTGLQLGVAANYAKSVTGGQIGIVNVA